MSQQIYNSVTAANTETSEPLILGGNQAVIGFDTDGSGYVEFCLNPNVESATWYNSIYGTMSAKTSFMSEPGWYAVRVVSVGGNNTIEHGVLA